jgi:nitrate reductase NapE component
MYPPPPRLTPVELAVRSLLPIAAFCLLATVPLVGAYGFAALTLAWWLVQRRLG